jgi:hypothetical protein
MKREIKFRGMDITGEWHYGNLAVITKKMGLTDPGYYISNDAGKPFAYMVRPETVGQYTGLKDRNGKEIYEGDIFVDNSYGEDVGRLVDSVVWNNETGAWVWGKDEVALIAESVDTIMVIGNIYDNPDLLEGEKA